MQYSAEPVGLIRRQRAKDAPVRQGLARHYKPVEFRDGEFAIGQSAVDDVDGESLPKRKQDAFRNATWWRYAIHGRAYRLFD